LLNREKEGIGVSKRETIEARVEAILTPLVMENDISVYDVEYVKEASDWYLRIYITKPEGITIQDCEKISRAMSEKLDELDFIEEAYIFEVSSPGLGRTLKKDKHFLMSIGEEVEIKTYKPIQKQREFTGILESFDNESIIIKSSEEQIKFQRADIALIRLALDF